MSDFDLTSVAEKIRRAVEHHDELQRAVILWTFDQDYNFVEARPDYSTSEYVLTVKPLTPPLRAAAIFGDFVHNLRSALDHFARQLLVAQGGVPLDGGGGTMFPILKASLPDGRPPTLKAKFGQLGGALLEVLDAVQPYQWGDRWAAHPLWQLSELDIIDKHRMLHTTVLRARGQAAFGTSEEASPGRYRVNVVEGQEARVSVAPSDLHDEPRVTGTWKLTLGLAEPTVADAVPIDAVTARLMVHVIGEVVMRFMDRMHPGLPADLAQHMIDTGVVTGSLQDEISSIAQRGWD